jgi:hypothetical protein
MKAIDDILRKYVGKTQGLNSFGSGTRSYSNLDDGKLPRVWRHKVGIVDVPNATLKIHSTYNVVFDLCDQLDHDATPDQINEAFDKLEPIYVNYINAVIKDADVDHDVNIEIAREPLIHDLDQNLVGWMVFMKIRVKQKTVLQCPSN